MRARRRQAGFSYLVLLLWMAIGSFILAAAMSKWSFESKRERETELIFRGEQYRLAIESYAAPVNLNGCSNLQQLPVSLSDLLDDHRCGLTRHHLRRLYPDPITRRPEWGLVMASGAIQGVYSMSEATPLKQIAGGKTYRDWKFVAAVNGIAAVPTARADGP